MNEGKILHDRLRRREPMFAASAMIQEPGTRPLDWAHGRFAGSRWASGREGPRSMTLSAVEIAGAREHRKRSDRRSEPAERRMLEGRC